jgi:hypothetical protein
MVQWQAMVALIAKVMCHQVFAIRSLQAWDLLIG